MTPEAFFKYAIVGGIGTAAVYVAASVLFPATAIQPKKQPVGLKNDNRNSCYANAAIQALAALPSFRQFLAAEDAQSLPLCGALNATMRALRHMQFGKQSISNLPIIREMQIVLHVRISLAQQDCHEFLMLLLDAVERETMRVNDYIQGRVLEASTCAVCGKSTSRWQSYNILSLYLPDTASISLHELWRLHFKDAIVQGVDCIPCSVKTSHVLKYTPTLWPRILALHLCRAADYLHQDTNRANVTFEDILTIGNTLYELRAVVAHSGRSNTSGHYVCYRLHGSKWWEFSDSKVKRVMFEQVKAKTSKVYILWYDKQSQS